MTAPTLSRDEVDLLFQGSEKRPTLYAGRDQNPDGVAHALAQHYLITNVGLAERRDDARSGTIAFFTAYITRADMVTAAFELLNAPVGRWAREQLFDVAATAKRPRGSHTGTRAAIQHVGQTFRVRYAGATGIAEVSSCRMYLDRIDERRLKLHIHTFYPTLQKDDRLSWAEIKYRDGKRFSVWP